MLYASLKNKKVQVVIQKYIKTYVPILQNCTMHIAQCTYLRSYVHIGQDNKSIYLYIRRHAPQSYPQGAWQDSAPPAR